MYLPVNVSSVLMLSRARARMVIEQEETSMKLPTMSNKIRISIRFRLLVINSDAAVMVKRLQNEGEQG
jgi:hypothetical protein